jgi:P pilus assembly chaperone PapD
MKKLLIAVAFLLSLFKLSLVSANVDLDKVVVNLSEGKRVALLTVKNRYDVDQLVSVTQLDSHYPASGHISILPKMSVIAPGKSQVFKIILKPNFKSEVEVFETLTVISSVSHSDKKDSSRVSINLRQTLPIIISPLSLAENNKKWEGVIFEFDNVDFNLNVSNPTPYVIRINPVLKLRTGVELSMPGSILLPKSNTIIPVDETIVKNDGLESLEYSPVSNLGATLAGRSIKIIKK